MQKNLVIVESPAKAKTIEKFLGKDYRVMSSYGHIRDLSTKELGIDVAHDFKPQYVVPEEKKKLVAELKKASQDAREVLLASDEDREGEAIAWHLSEALELSPDRTQRIVFHEITKPAILHALDTPRGIDINLVNAQQARRVLDRIVGFELSPVLWRKVKPALSAGRVQSVAVRLIVEREREIARFVSEASFRVVASFLLPDGKTLLKAELNRRLKDRDEAEAFLRACQDPQARFTIEDTTKRPVKKTPAPPFTTSTLQQEAARKRLKEMEKAIVHDLFALKGAYLLQRISAINSRIKELQTEGRLDEAIELMKEQKQLNEIKVALSRELGDRIILKM